jgi:hypothetical protein
MATSKAKDLADFISKQSASADDILETGAMQLPAGTTAQRPTAVAGMIRYNSTTNLSEYYDGTIWKAIDSPPTISSVSPTHFDTAGDTITVTGSGFDSGATVKIVAPDNQELTAASVTVTSATSLTFDATSAMVADDNDPYDVVVTNPSGLAATLEDALDFAPEPAWTKAAGSLGTIYDGGRGSVSITTGATSTESDATITYAVTTGSLPSGLSIAANTGTITGSTSAVGSSTTTTFTLTATATDSGSNTTTNTRQYSIVQVAPVVTSYTSTGSFTFSVPTGVASVDVLAVAGGGGGGSPWTTNYNGSGGGGAGGLLYRPAFPVTPGGSVTGSVGAGGKSTSGNSPSDHARPGTPTTFGTLSAIGGGGGGGNDNAGLPAPLDINGQARTGKAGAPGGSGGASKNAGEPAGSGLQPSQPGDSGTYGFGNNGTSPSLAAMGAGGGGAGGVGQALGPTFPQGPQGKGGDGGVGKQYGISGSQVYYAGGGGGGSLSTINGISAGGQGGGGAGNDGVNYPNSWPTPAGATPGQGGTPAFGTANRGGGGGAGGSYSSGNGQSYGGHGGPGVVIVSY